MNILVGSGINSTVLATKEKDQNMLFCTINPVNKQAKPYNPMLEDHSYFETIFTFLRLKEKIGGGILLQL